MSVVTCTSTARPKWIGYRCLMQGTYQGPIFSYTVDAFQDEVG